MQKPSDYKYIKYWGQMMGSSPQYIFEQQRKAAEENAPLTAIYDRVAYNAKQELVSQGWATVYGITNEATQHYFMIRGWMTPDWKVPENANSA